VFARRVPSIFTKCVVDAIYETHSKWYNLSNLLLKECKMNDFNLNDKSDGNNMAWEEPNIDLNKWFFRFLVTVLGFLVGYAGILWYPALKEALTYKPEPQPTEMPVTGWYYAPEQESNDQVEVVLTPTTAPAPIELSLQQQYVPLAIEYNCDPGDFADAGKSIAIDGVEVTTETILDSGEKVFPTKLYDQPVRGDEIKVFVNGEFLRSVVFLKMPTGLTWLGVSTDQSHIEGPWQDTQMSCLTMSFQEKGDWVVSVYIPWGFDPAKVRIKLINAADTN
jgi:hypothetical protein